MLEGRRFAIKLDGMIDLDYGVGGLLGVNGDRNWHLQGGEKRGGHRKLHDLGGRAGPMTLSRGVRRGLKGLGGRS